jgi:hypothetical protein
MSAVFWGVRPIVKMPVIAMGRIRGEIEYL